jgi:hypothetical protein
MLGEKETFDLLAQVQSGNKDYSCLANTTLDADAVRFFFVVRIAVSQQDCEGGRLWRNGVSI